MRTRDPKVCRQLANKPTSFSIFSLVVGMLFGSPPAFARAVYLKSPVVGQGALRNPISAQINVRTITNGDTSVNFGKNALMSGATVSILANGSVAGGGQSIGAVLSGSNATGNGSTLSANMGALSSSFLNGFSSVPSNAQSNAINKTTGNFSVNLEATNVGNVNLTNITRVVGGKTFSQGGK
jgi:hypothetical protein